VFSASVSSLGCKDEVAMLTHNLCSSEIVTALQRSDSEIEWRLRLLTWHTTCS